MGAIGRAEARPRRVSARWSRAQWLAYASTLTMAGCGGGKLVASDGGGIEGMGTTDWVTATGTFTCGADQEAGVSCDARTQYCLDDTYEQGGYSCVAKDQGPLAATDGGGHCPCPPDDSGIGGCLFSGSFTKNSSGEAFCSGNFACYEDESGITVSCHTCYGAPPLVSNGFARRGPWRA